MAQEYLVARESGAADHESVSQSLLGDRTASFSVAQFEMKYRRDDVRQCNPVLDYSEVLSGADTESEDEVPLASAAARINGRHYV
jgi:hypothetical protein